MKKNTVLVCTTIFGIFLLSIGLVLLKIIETPQGIMIVFPYICVGFGGGIFGHGMGSIISNKTIKNNPDAAKKIEIEEHDERNIAISNRAKAKAYDMMVFVFGASLFTFALMGGNMTELLLLVFSYLFVIGNFIYYLSKFNKEM
jgi:hypothetical protein